MCVFHDRVKTSIDLFRRAVIIYMESGTIDSDCTLDMSFIRVVSVSINGRTVGSIQVGDEDEVMLISSGGTLVRTPVSEISVIGRNTQGVTLIRVEKGQRLVGLARVESMDSDQD